MNHHLTIYAKSIMTIRNHAVCFCFRYIGGDTCSNASKSFKAGTSAAQIVCTIHVIDAARSFAIHDNIIVALHFINAIFRTNSLISCSILGKNIPVSRGGGVVLNKADAGIHIGIAAKVISLAFNFNPHTGVEAGTIAVSCTCCIGCPSALGGAVLIEGILDAADSLFANIQLIVRACVAVTLVSSLPALLQNTVDGIVQAAVHFEDAGSGGIDLAAAFIGADKLAVNDLIVMGDLNLGDDGAPIDDRLTGFAVSAVFIARCSSGSLLILYSQLIIVDMIGRRNSSQLSCNTDGASERLAVNHAVHNFAIDVDNRLVTHICNGNVGVGNKVVAVISPHTDRDAHQSIIRCLTDRADAFHRNGQQFGNLVIIQSDFETIGHDSALGFPLVGIVQLQNSNQLIDAGKIRNIDVHIVDGLCLGGLAGIIVAAQFNHGIARNSEGTGDLSGVAQLVLNLKYNGMCACAEGNITLGGEHIAIDRGFYHDTINGDLAGGKVERSIISNGCRECNIIAIDNGAVLQRNSDIGSGISGVRNSGQLSVIYSRAVVQGDVVDVESKLSRSGGLNISTDERGGTRVAFIGSNRCAKIVVLRNIDGHVYPSGFRNIRLCSRVQIGPLAGGSRGEHKVILLAGVRAISVLNVELRLECKTRCTNRNIHPHTESSSLHAVSNIAQNDGVTSIEEHVIRPAGKGSVGVIQSPCQCIAAVSDLATICSGGNKRGAAQVLIELASQRIRTNQRVVHTVVLAPLLSLFKAHKVSLVAIFKVPNDLRTLTELDGIGKYGSAEGNCYINACNRFVRSSGKLESSQNACLFIRQSHRYTVGIHIDIGLAGHSHNGQGNGANLFSRRIGNHGGGCGKLEHFRVSNSNGLGTN